MNTTPSDKKSHTGLSPMGVKLTPLKNFPKKNNSSSTSSPVPALAPEQQPQSQIKPDLSNNEEKYESAKEKINAVTDATPKTLTQLINDITPLITINGNIPLKITYSNPSIPPPPQNAPKYYIYDSTSQGTRNNEILKKNFVYENENKSLYETFIDKLVSLINGDKLIQDNYNTNEINKIKNLLIPTTDATLTEVSKNNKKNILEEKITQAFAQKQLPGKKQKLSDDSAENPQITKSDEGLQFPDNQSNKSQETSIPQLELQEPNQSPLQTFPIPQTKDLSPQELPKIPSSQPPQELSSNNIIATNIVNEIKGAIDAVQIGLQQSSQQSSSQQPEQGQGQGAQEQGPNNSSMEESIRNTIEKTTNATTSALQNQSSSESSQNASPIMPSTQQSSQPPQDDNILAKNIATTIQQLIQSINASLKPPSREVLKEYEMGNNIHNNNNIIYNFVSIVLEIKKENDNYKLGNYSNSIVFEHNNIYKNEGRINYINNMIVYFDKNSYELSTKIKKHINQLSNPNIIYLFIHWAIKNDEPKYKLLGISVSENKTPMQFKINL